MKLTEPLVEPSAENTPALAGLLQEPLVVEFPAGIPGFEACHRFVLIASADLSPLGCLKALDSPEASFLVIDPTLLCFGYDLTLSEFDRARIGATIGDSLLWLAIVTVTGQGATANLRAPIVINPRRMVGYQYIRDREDYSVGFSINLG